MSDKINQHDEDGKKHGCWKAYFKGNLVFERYYIHGKKVGYWIKNHPNGYPLYRITFVDGKSNGYCEDHYFSGKFWGCGGYIYGKKVGLWLWRKKDKNLSMSDAERLQHTIQIKEYYLS